MPDEEIVYFGSVHWFIFVPGIVLLLIGIGLFGVDSEWVVGPVMGPIVIIFGIGSLVRAIFAKVSTEVAVTTKRVIAKVGFIRRNTVELNHSKVESFTVDQSIPGRMLGFGTLVVNGTGGGKSAFRTIDSPLEFRRQAMETIDSISHE